MKLKLITYSVVLSISLLGLNCNAQNISFNDNCIDKNSSLFAESLINLNGIGFVSKLLEEDSNIILFLEVDSAGNVLKIVKTKGEFSSIMQSGLLSFLINEKICFKICYETLPGKSDEEMFQLTKQEIRSSHRTSFLISISFPGSLMSLYQYEKEKLEQQNIELSKIVYLKVMISRFLINRI